MVILEVAETCSMKVDTKGREGQVEGHDIRMV